MDEIQKEAIKGLSGLITDFCKISLKQAAAIGRSEFDKLKIKFEQGMHEYMQRNVRRQSLVKTLLHRYNPVRLENIYVPTRISFGKNIEEEEEFVASIYEKFHIVITGVAGSGKSMLMKHLFIRFCTNDLGYIPIFLELRALDDDQNNILDYITSQIKQTIPSFNRDQLEFGLKIGKFIFLLDGLDEVESSKRDAVSADIVNLSIEFEMTPIIISSRPENRFRSWQSFYVGQVLPMNLSEVLLLLEKIEYDQEVKSLFIEEVNNRLYDSHNSFMSNPLLCTMMLMTYSEFSEIPTKMHIFYSNAFDVLFNRHDRMKISFRRKFYTDLAADDFKKAVSAFCTFTYLQQQFLFTEAEAVEYSKKSLQFCKFPSNPESFVKDLSESISFLLQDGDQLSFIHRSFQEYFAAIFLAERNFPTYRDAIEKIASSRTHDQVINLLIQINSDAIENKYLVSRCDYIVKRINKIDVNANPAALFRLFYLGYMVDDHDKIQFMIGKSSGTGMRYAPYIGFLSVAESGFLKNPVTELPNNGYDWSDIKTKYQKHEVDGAKIDILNPKDDAIIGTPIHDYLIKLKQRIIDMKADLNNRSRDRAEMLSNIVIPLD